MSPLQFRKLHVHHLGKLQFQTAIAIAISLSAIDCIGTMVHCGPFLLVLLVLCGRGRRGSWRQSEFELARVAIKVLLRRLCEVVLGRLVVLVGVVETWQSSVFVSSVFVSSAIAPRGFARVWNLCCLVQWSRRVALAVRGQTLLAVTVGALREVVLGLVDLVRVQVR
jgi:hypothetical protein